MAKRGSSGLSFLLAIDKPKGLTSHDVVNRCRRLFGEKRIGHTGTLDPLASGILCVAVGPAARLDAFLSSHNKTYTMDVAFGCATATDDAEGEVVASGNIPPEVFEETYARTIVASLVGAGKQLPPVYSAVKVGGQKSYAAARAGNVIELRPRDFEVYEATLDSIFEMRLGDLLDQTLDEDRTVPVWRVTMKVSGGTYMRSIARDLGKRFGCGAFVSELRRIALDSLDLSDCVTLEELEVSPHHSKIDPLRLLAMRYAFVRDPRIIGQIENGAMLACDALSLNVALPECTFDEYCCTTQVFPSADPCFDGEMVAVVVDNRIKALYKFDETKQRFCARCVFPVGVERGSNL
jgi:tRNA pseudouridine55 synthase